MGFRGETDDQRAERIALLGRALNGKSRYKLAFQCALEVIGFDAVEIDDLTQLAYDCQFDEINARMTMRRHV